MSAIAQHSVKTLARAVEPHAESAWPARETLRLDGWLLRFGEGYSSRLNSVSALAYCGAKPIAIFTTSRRRPDANMAL